MGTSFETGSKTRGWLLDKFAMGTANYWFTFVADFSTAIFFLTWEIAFHHEKILGTAAAFPAGYMLWGLTEYTFHRWVYHQAEGIFGDGHRIHHNEDRVLIAMPWFMTTLTMFGLWYLCARVIGMPHFSSLLAGWLLGFVWYSLIHHSHHHWNVRLGWIRRLKAYHRVHHHFPQYNYGVTMRFWDFAFGTRFRKGSPTTALQQTPADPVLVGEAAL